MVELISISKLTGDVKFLGINIDLTLECANFKLDGLLNGPLAAALLVLIGLDFFDELRN